MGHRTSYLAVVLVLLTILGCWLPGQTVPPTPTGNASPTVPATPPGFASPTAPPAASPVPTAEPLPPSDFAAVLDAEVAAGEIRYEDGLIRLLRSFLGDPEVSLPPSYGEVVTTEGTGIVERAWEYVEGGTDESARTEIRRLLDLIIPSREQLDAYSEPAEVSSMGRHLASPGQQVNCGALWADGFPLGTGVATYPCFRHTRETVPGVTTFSVYFPAAWYGDPIMLPWFQRARDAAYNSLSALGDYGPFDEVTLVFSFLDLGTAGYLATTHPYRSDESCPILIYPIALSLGQDQFHQVIAHEIFHCYQFKNLEGQMQVQQGTKKWWSEASAEYFSNVVYPEVNYEYRWADNFDGQSSSTPLYQMGYENFGFFQFLANQWGNNGVITFLESMPTGGDAAEQRDRLAAWPGMQEVFHEFGKAYLDNSIADTSGGSIPFSPSYDHVVEVARGSSLQEYSPDAFVLDRHELFFVDDTRFDLHGEVTEGEGRHSADPGARPGAWGELPTTVNTACAEAEYALLVTDASPSGAPGLVLSIRTNGTALEEDIGCETCLLGTWNLDNGSYLAHMGSEWPIIQGMLPMFGLDTSGASSSPTEVFGLMQMTFTDDGGVSGSQEGWGIAGVVTGPDGSLQARMTYSGSAEGAWHIQEDDSGEMRYVVFEDTAFSLMGQMTFDRFTLAPMNTGGTNDSAFLGTPQRFLCEADTLTFAPTDSLGPIIFHRAEPSEGP